MSWSCPIHGLSDADLDTVFSTGPLRAPERLTLRDIVALLEHSYCGSIGYEYGHMASAEQRRWIRTRLEQPIGHQPFNTDQKKHILQRLTAAEGMERYLHTKYVGQKRFSLEGGESLIPMLDQIIQQGGADGVKEVVIGMAHRGRLNVLVNTLGKMPKNLFSEFEGKHELDGLAASGDVKYHQGFSSDIQTAGGTVHLSLAFNPSHLEIVSPVVEGSVRARQERRDDRLGSTVLPISIHGDAAFAGQGVVMETFQMSGCQGYRTGGHGSYCGQQIRLALPPVTRWTPAQRRTAPKWQKWSAHLFSMSMVTTLRRSFSPLKSLWILGIRFTKTSSLT